MSRTAYVIGELSVYKYILCGAIKPKGSWVWDSFLDVEYFASKLMPNKYGIYEVLLPNNFQQDVDFISGSDKYNAYFLLVDVPIIKEVTQTPSSNSSIQNVKDKTCPMCLCSDDNLIKLSVEKYTFQHNVSYITYHTITLQVNLPVFTCKCGCKWIDDNGIVLKNYALEQYLKDNYD